MKTIRFMILGIVLLFASVVQSQVSMTINIGAPPAWGPAGYSSVSYYYLPDVEAYYDVHSSMFIFMSGGVWIHRSSLPSHYRHYDLYNGYKVVLNDYHGNTPYKNFNQHKSKYKKGYHPGNQKSIGHNPGNGNNKQSHDNNKKNHDSKPDHNSKSGHDNKQNHDNGHGKQK